MSSTQRSADLAAIVAATLAVLLPLRSHANGCDSGYVNPVVIENCRTDRSTWSSSWKVNRDSHVYDTRVLAGYASRSSVNPGDTIHFYVRSPQSPAGFTIEIYRLGWYGGFGGRRLLQTPTRTAPAQPACHWQNQDTADAYFTCSGWRVSYSLEIPRDWASGVYIASVRSVATAPAPQPPGMPYAHDIIFIVRDDTRKADFIYQQAVATEQAYNSYQYGPSLYSTRMVNGNRVPWAKASFERPFDALDNLQFYRFELPFISWMEREGYDVVYTTDVDTHERVEPLSTKYKALLVSGHSEYWSKRMYDAAEAARGAGVHLGFLGGDTLYWQMRLEDESAPVGDGTHTTRDRVMVVFRKPYPPSSLGLGDPNPDQGLQTIYWRDFPLMRDEEGLMGVHFTHPSNCREHMASWAGPGTPPEQSRPQAAPLLRNDPQPLVVADSANWVYDGTGLRTGDTIPNVYGQEADSFEVGRGLPSCGYDPSDPPARPPAYRAGTFSILSSSPFEYRAISGQQVVHQATHVPVNSVVYQACSGAWVFAAGDVMWGNALAPSFLLGKDYSSTSIQQMTRNVLDVFAGRKVMPSSDLTCVQSTPRVVTTVTNAIFPDE